MLNKLLLIFLLVGLTVGLPAQSYRYGRRSRNRTQKQTVEVSNRGQQKEKNQGTKKNSDSQKSSAGKKQSKKDDLSRKFDPRKPGLSEANVKRVLEERIQKRLLERELAPDIKSCTKETFLSQSECSSILSEYRNLTNNFELIEVTRIKPEWYKQLGLELEKFQKIADALYFSIRRSSNEQYEDALEKFKKQQEVCLKFLKEKQPRISKGEYEALFVKNTKIRQQNYLKRLQREREAAAKRRQEMIRKQNEMLQIQKYLKEHPEYLKEHPEFLKEHPELQKLFPNALKNTSNAASPEEEKIKDKKSRK